MSFSLIVDFGPVGLQYLQSVPPQNIEQIVFSDID